MPEWKCCAIYTAVVNQRRGRGWQHIVYAKFQCMHKFWTRHIHSYDILNIFISQQLMNCVIHCGFTLFERQAFFCWFVLLSYFIPLFSSSYKTVKLTCFARSNTNARIWVSEIQKNYIFLRVLSIPFIWRIVH